MSHVKKSGEKPPNITVTKLNDSAVPIDLIFAGKKSMTNEGIDPWYNEIKKIKSTNF